MKFLKQTKKSINTNTVGGGGSGGPGRAGWLVLGGEGMLGEVRVNTSPLGVAGGRESTVSFTAN